jgi:hypothetical protein
LRNNCSPHGRVSFYLARKWFVKLFIYLTNDLEILKLLGKCLGMFMNVCLAKESFACLDEEMEMVLGKHLFLIELEYHFNINKNYLLG